MVIFVCSHLNMPWLQTLNHLSADSEDPELLGSPTALEEVLDKGMKRQVFQ